MPTIVELKAFLTANGVKGCSNKNKTQLLQMVAEYNNRNFLSLLPKVILQTIGTYLNYANAVKVSKLQKNFKNMPLFSFQTCASISYFQQYTTLEQYYNYKERFINILHNLLINNPKVTAISLNFNFKNLRKLIDETIIITEMINLLTPLKNFINLSDLNLTLNYHLSDYGVEDQFPLFKFIRSLNLNLLVSDLNLYTYQSLQFLINPKTLNYLELQHVTFENDDTKIQNNLHTLVLTEKNTRDFNFSLSSFSTLKRLVLNLIDSFLLDDLINVPNLEVLEYDSYNILDNNFDWKNYVPNIPKTLKYLKVNTLEINVTETTSTLEIYLLQSLEVLEYFVVDYFTCTYKDLLFLLQTLDKTTIKYIYISNIDVIDYIDEEDEYYMENQNLGLVQEINKILTKDKFKLNFGVLRETKNYLESTFHNLNSISIDKDANSIYTLKQNYYSPKQWLGDHNYFDPLTCD